MQLNTLTRWLQAMSAYPWQWVLRRITLPVYDRMTSVALSSAGLVIKAAGSTLAKTGASAATVIANGVLVSIAAATDMPALAGTISQNNYGGWAFFVDSGGNLTSAFMTQASSLAGLKFPQFPVGQACLGFVYLHPTAADFVGGTTALDAASTNAVFVSTTDGFDPYCLIGGQLGSE